MKVVESWKALAAQAMQIDGAQGVSKRLLIGPQDGAPLFALRIFEISAGGHTPLHRHGFEHEIIVLLGRGVLKGEDREHPIEPGAVIFVKPGELHQLRAAPDSELCIACVVPKEHA